jgi:hypothetical protein
VKIWWDASLPGSPLSNLRQSRELRGILHLTSRKTKVNVGMRQTNNKVMTNMTKNLNPDMMENRLLGMTIGAVPKRGIS